MNLSTGYPKSVGNMRKLNVNFGSVGAAMLWLGVMTMATSALAATPPNRNLGAVKAGNGQPRLELRRVGPVLEAAVCAPACAWSKAARITLEEPFAEAEAVFSALELGSNHRAGLVSLSASERKYQWLVAAPLKAPPSEASVESSNAPTVVNAGPVDANVLFAGEVGLSQGEPPDRSGSVVEVIPTETGAASVVVGNVQEDVSLCGRQALLAPKIVHPDTLTLRGIKFQRVPRLEREASISLPVLPRTSQLSNRVLNPLVASSGSKAPGVLADDDVGTVWTEGRGGTGGGEFVVMRAPSALGLTGLTFSLPQKPDALYSPPESFWVVTDTSVFKAVVASDPKTRVCVSGTSHFPHRCTPPVWPLRWTPPKTWARTPRLAGLKSAPRQTLTKHDWPRRLQIWIPAGIKPPRLSNSCKTSVGRRFSASRSVTSTIRNRVACERST